jgi:Fe-S-cluster containining protein
MTKTITDDRPRAHFDCTKCPAFCCSVYERVKVTRRDLKRLARHFGVSYESAERRYTKDHEGERVLKRTGDAIFEKTCTFLNQETRGCSIYDARPGTCRTYPARSRCAYYDLLQFERRQQGNDSVVPVVKIVFHEVEEATVSDGDGSETVLEWDPKEMQPAPNGATRKTGRERRERAPIALRDEPMTAPSPAHPPSPHEENGARSRHRPRS